MNKWISVKDRLPEDIGHKLVALNDGTVFLGLYIGGNLWDLEDSPGCTVTHWMELPDPPKD